MDVPSMENGVGGGTLLRWKPFRLKWMRWETCKYDLQR